MFPCRRLVPSLVLTLSLLRATGGMSTRATGGRGGRATDGGSGRARAGGTAGTTVLRGTGGIGGADGGMTTILVLMAGMVGVTVPVPVARGDPAIGAPVGAVRADVGARSVAALVLRMRGVKALLSRVSSVSGS